jgi:hypothetical protein
VVQSSQLIIKPFLIKVIRVKRISSEYLNVNLANYFFPGITSVGNPQSKGVKKQKTKTCHDQTDTNISEVLFGPLDQAGTYSLHAQAARHSQYHGSQQKLTGKFRARFIDPNYFSSRGRGIRTRLLLDPNCSSRAMLQFLRRARLIVKSV